MTNRHAIAAALVVAGLATATTAQEDQTLKIKVIAGEATLPATLDDTAAARDFLSMLPLELTLSDYHGVEKVADLGKRLDASDAPPSYEPKAGDITQYAPWKNLAIFIEAFSDSRGLVRLGAFDGDYSVLEKPGDIAVRIEVAD